MSQHNTGRRRFLLSGSALIALPMFESLFSSKAFAQMAGPTRLMIMKFPIGCYKNSWQPTGTGTNFTLPAQLASLNTYKEHLVLPTRLTNKEAGGYIDGAGDHARSGGCYMTNVRINKSESDIRAATSIDKRIADAVGQSANNRWLVLAAPGTGYGDSGYGGSYTSNISWISPTQPASRITSTSAAFDALFPNAGMTTPADEAAKKARYRKSILDNGVAEANSLRAKLGKDDQHKLDQYLTSVREVEAGIAGDQMNQPQACTPGTNPGNSNDFQVFTRRMMDISVLAMSCDRSRIVSYFLDYEGTNRSGIGGVTQGHHTVSHHADDANYPEQYRRISQWYAEQFAYFLSKMVAVKPDSQDKTLLDSSIVVFGSDIHDGNEHGHSNLPIVVAGKGNGTLTTGRVVDTAAPLANLWVSLAQKAGATGIASHGDSTGPLGGL